MKSSTKYFNILCIFLSIFFLFISINVQAETFNYDSLRSLPVLDQGRIKPLDTFARESVSQITGKTYFEGKDPLVVLLLWLAQGESTFDSKVILSRHKGLNKRLEISATKNYVSEKELLENKNFKSFLQGITLKQQEGKNLDVLEKEGSTLYNRLDLLHRIVVGEALVIFPVQKNHWESLATHPGKENLELVTALLSSLKSREANIFNQSAAALVQKLSVIADQTGAYPKHLEMQRELTFNHVRPFQKAWIFSLIAFVVVLLAAISGQHFFYASAIFSVLLSCSFSIYGFIVRSFISGHPPVTNMYESVIWVSFAALLFALIFEAIYRSKFFLLSGAAGATIGFVLSDNLPNVLNPNINPLVPVLRDNFWLTIHVLTITLSYAAFLLAMGVGQMALGYYAFKPQAKETIKNLNLFLYRAIQVGVILVAAGTILGGVWANYSWGRFWGWDPKEVWALIVLLGYIIILHGRFAGWLRDFGMALWSVLAFLLVIMAWYGVNFILGVGLHAYGFSSGGLTGVSIFVAIQLAWVLFATWRHKRVRDG